MKELIQALTTNPDVKRSLDISLQQSFTGSYCLVKTYVNVMSQIGWDKLQAKLECLTRSMRWGDLQRYTKWF
ncbi:MAG: hypothetical protein LEGION0403_FIIPPAGN_01726 [Legionella sp.]